MNLYVFATNNQHKLAEVSAMSENKISIVGMNAIGCFDDIPETALTLEGNALLKAQWIYNKYSVDCIADDTGLEVEALSGRPGVFSARYAGENATSESNIRKLLQELANESNRKAQFRTVIALIQKGKTYYFSGIVRGTIGYEQRGDGGFGYDSVFIPEGFSQTFAEMDAALKNKISHRALAINECMRFLIPKK